MSGNFAEMNAQMAAIDAATMMADDMSEARELDTLHEMEMLKMRERFDRSTALHEFILNARYEAEHPVHTHR